jgi:hypothetical protein
VNLRNPDDLTHHRVSLTIQQEKKRRKNPCQKLEWSSEKSCHTQEKNIMNNDLKRKKAC